MISRKNKEIYHNIRELFLSLNDSKDKLNTIIYLLPYAFRDDDENLVCTADYAWSKEDKLIEGLLKAIIEINRLDRFEKMIKPDLYVETEQGFEPVSKKTE